MKSTMLISQYGLSEDDMRASAPSVYASKAWEKTSARYSFLPTNTVLETLKRETGLIPYSVSQSGTRIHGKENYTKHMVRLRRRDNAPAIVGGIVPEVILINSHDRGSAFILSAGVFRYICANGMVVSIGIDASYKVIHYSTTIEAVIEAAEKITRAFPMVLDRVERFTSISLPVDRQLRMAELALGLRYETDKAPFHFSRLLETRRYADNKQDLWTITNVIQENLLQGQARLNHHERGSRVVRSIDSNMQLNRGIWELAEEFSK